MPKEPDVNRHRSISYAKSAVRIFGFLNLLHNLPAGVILLVVAELLGIVEEFE